MLERLRRELPRLADAVVKAEVDGDGAYELKQTGAADAARSTASKARRKAGGARTRAKRAARTARRVPGVAQAEGELKGAVASQGDLAIAGYDRLPASEIAKRLPGLSQVELAKIDAYERRHDGRATILAKTRTLRGSEPWPGYDEQSVEDVRGELSDADRRKAEHVRSYERSHKARSGVLEAAERERVHA